MFVICTWRPLFIVMHSRATDYLCFRRWRCTFDLLREWWQETSVLHPWYYQNGRLLFMHLHTSMISSLNNEHIRWKKAPIFASNLYYDGSIILYRIFPFPRCWKICHNQILHRVFVISMSCGRNVRFYLSLFWSIVNNMYRRDLVHR